MSDLKVTIDDLTVETYESWAKSFNESTKVDRKAIQEIASRIEKANYEHLLKDSQPLIFRPPNSFASFTPFFSNPKEMFTYRLFDEQISDRILNHLEGSDEKEEGQASDKEESENNSSDSDDFDLSSTSDCLPNASYIHNLFLCIKKLNKICQAIQNERERCQKG